MIAFLSHIKKIPGSYVLPLIVGSIGVIFFLYGLIVYYKQNAPEPQAKEEAVPTAVPVKSVKSIKIDVEGSVLHAGVYSLAVDSRVQDALLATGGVSENADRDFVEKHINLAAKISDGTKIYIPSRGEYPISSPAQSQISNDQSGTQVGGDNTTGININDATIAQLDELPGIGKVSAQKIITNRPYADVQELLSKKVVTQKVFDEMKDIIRVF